MLDSRRWREGEHPVVERTRAKVRPAGKWATTFERFRPGPTPLVRSIEVRVADWSRPQPGTAPMFNAGVLERLTLAHPAFPLAVYAPAGIYLLWYARQHGATIGTLVATYIAGLLVWSLLE